MENEESPFYLFIKSIDKAVSNLGVSAQYMINLSKKLTETLLLHATTFPTFHLSLFSLSWFCFIFTLFGLFFVTEIHFPFSSDGVLVILLASTFKFVCLQHKGNLQIIIFLWILSLLLIYNLRLNNNWTKQLQTFIQGYTKSNIAATCSLKRKL